MYEYLCWLRNPGCDAVPKSLVHIVDTLVSEENELKDSYEASPEID